jgi:hypothetical protein
MEKTDPRTVLCTVLCMCALQRLWSAAVGIQGWLSVHGSLLSCYDTVAEAKPIAVSIYNILMLVIVNAILYGVAKSNIISITVQVCS